MSSTVFFTTTCLVLGAILLSLAMKYLSAAYQARARIASDNAYQDLAQKAVTAQGQIALTLSTLQSDLSQVAARLASVEKMLKEVG